MVALTVMSAPTPETVAVTSTEPPTVLPGSRKKRTPSRSALRSGRPGFAIQIAVGWAPGAGSGLGSVLPDASAVTSGGPDQVTVAPAGSSAGDPPAGA